MTNSRAFHARVNAHATEIHQYAANVAVQILQQHALACVWPAIVFKTTAYANRTTGLSAASTAGPIPMSAMPDVRVK